MPLIEKNVLLQIADRAAKQYEYLADAFALLTQQGGGYYAEIVTATDDPDVEIPLLGNYRLVDEGLNVDFCVPRGTQLSSIIGSMDVHFNTREPTGEPLQKGGWDGYLYDNDCRVSWYFNKLYKDVRNRWMMAVNVFSEGNDELADLEIIAGPSVQFTDGINYGDGKRTNPANGTYYAASQLKLVVTTMGVSPVDFRLHLKDKNNNPTTFDITVPAGQPPGTIINIGTDVNRYLDVFNATFIPFGSFGTLGDHFTIRNLKERQISL